MSSRSPATSVSSHRSSTSDSSSSLTSLSDSFADLAVHDIESGTDCACSRCRSNSSSHCAYPSWPKGTSFDRSAVASPESSETPNDSRSVGSSHITDEDLLDCPEDQEIKRNASLDVDSEPDDCIAPGYHGAAEKPKQRGPPATVAKQKSKVQVKKKDGARRK